ncbi:MAG TPA: glutamine--fructose-6-phosphate transaminase (isomerizing) [Bacteroidota bacterium]|nr:glutamine--fructose-6-phosphate transaminase (isomerizing) [Bacteroidota bacterium]
MCGIVGYLGTREAAPILLEGLRHLEYRGYDSAGIAVVADNQLHAFRRVGKVKNLAESLNGSLPKATLGIAHTRWATHGVPSESNAHPHTDCTRRIALIHNGIIENHASLRTILERGGHRFSSATDTEVLVHLIEEHLRSTDDLETAVRRALAQVEGTYGIAVISTHAPGTLIVARKGSPLVIGIGSGEYICASDPTALAGATRRVIYLSDGEMAAMTANGLVIKNRENVKIEKDVSELDLELETIERCGYPHFMLKEIYEQPETIHDALRGRLLESDGRANLGGLREVMPRILASRRIILTGCGTSWHAGLIGRYMIEQYARLPVEVEYASEFRYRDPMLDERDTVFCISQSGETADTIAAMREALNRGALGLGICNVVGSTLARESDAGVYLHAGPEIGVASTKAFTSQLSVLALITLALARERGLTKEQGKTIIRELKSLPEKVSRILEHSDVIQKYAREFQDAQNFLYLGRGYGFPAALEGALKLKEISYIHAEGYPAAEMKHGPIALIDRDMPVVVIAPKDKTYEKILGNIEEVRARNGRVVVVANEDDPWIHTLSDHVIRIPKTIDMLHPILAMIPLQLLAYYIAVLRGCNVDQPRNLAKSVTVE